ncbi:MAG: bifunctional adenosylcobinamide kinase/adenosylcobinamide-phosphate guanylyltransferase [Desulfovibrio sp.]|nr:bifunctional adenosylcobinamide kinase/adenosylcobinamide-phosphate guanylyltransferase [Desulfovibrio sp.]
MSVKSVFFVGGVRSGKSVLAQRWAEARAPQRLYVATALADDVTMIERIARHRAGRGAGWQCLEAPLDPVISLQRWYSDTTRREAGVVLLDCVSLWIANMLGRGMTEVAIVERVDSLAALAAAPKFPLAVVSLEAGMGMVPMSALGRDYQDMLGMANQRLAGACDTVILVSCGLPLLLKGKLPEELCSR